MRTFTFNLLAVLSCIAMIGATSIENRAPAEAIDRRQLPVPTYVPWRQLMEVLTRLKFLPAALRAFGSLPSLRHSVIALRPSALAIKLAMTLLVDKRSAG
ncbi:hypothetical protein DFH94DRAFT_347015 [Russula ochroleuca]|uniref:Uncharacterized protein n=1 Tax=Russula ochroleuca TaxID=152965 RepID=A0A9P5MQE3_9AGAM|nr:hypothetical protein DFH94DRAFT_347015 [Russula ochroleuca]